MPTHPRIASGLTRVIPDTEFSAPLRRQSLGVQPMNFALVVLLFLSGPASIKTLEPPISAAPSPTQQEQNKAVARRVFDEIFNQGKFEVASEIYARDFVNHGLHSDYSLDDDQAAVRWEKTVAPDLTLTVDLIAAEGDLVTVVWTARGTHSVRSGWLPATGAKIEERGITVWRIVHGKIHDEWTSFDQLRLLRQVLSQLKWILFGAVCLLIIGVYVFGRMIRKVWARGENEIAHR